ncbi:MAG: insulinase family protein [Candidatus Eremiobacteraeota bacterium]|nr:insulinase family protein [Candidatus Eremiobacteraeota bacterium]
MIQSTQVKRSAAAICLGVSLFAFSKPAFAAAPAAARELRGTVAGSGASYVVRPDASVPTAAIELWFRTPSTGYGTLQPGIARVALASIAASQPSGRATTLAQLVNRVGGQLTFSVYPDMTSVGASVPAGHAGEILRAMTSAYFTPTLTEDGFKLGVRDTVVAGQVARYEVDHRLHDELFAHMFSGGPAHYAPVPYDVADVNRIAFNDARGFAQRGFRAGNTVISIVGNVDANVLNDVAHASGGAAMDAAIVSQRSSSSQSTSLKADVAGVGIAYAGPPIKDARAATALDFVADYLFHPETGVVGGKTRVSVDDYLSGQFVTLYDPGVLVVTFSGKNATSLRDNTFDAINSLRSPLDAKTFARARAAFAYHALADVQTPLTMADNLGWYTLQGNGLYAPGDSSETYAQAIESLDPSYVAGVVRKYLHDPTVVQLVSAPASTGETI